MNKSLPLLLSCGLLLGVFSTLLLPQKPSPAPQISHPYSFCFAPGTSKETIARYEQAAKLAQSNTGIRSAPARQVFNHWRRTATNGTSQGNQGDPVTLTWSIAPDTAFITADGSIPTEVSSNSNLRARLAEIYGGSATEPAAEQPWFFVFETAFASLSSMTGLNFVYEANDDGVSISQINQGILGRRGDLRVSGHSLDGDNGTLAYNYFPDFGDMVIDTSDSFFEDISNNSINLRNALEHEIGHGLGLNHVCPINQTKLMEPSISTNFIGVQFDDIYSLQRNYGDAFEKANPALDNDLLSRAAPLAVQSEVPFSYQWAGLDGSTDIDCYSFTVNANEFIDITITPSPNTYLEGAQAGDSCSAGTSFDSSIQQNLSLQLYDPSFSLILTRDNNPLGGAETISEYRALQSGTYYIRVTGDGNNSNQLYSIEISTSAKQNLFTVAGVQQTAELFSEENDAPDPGETIAFAVSLENTGSATALNGTATLSGPSGFVPLDGSVSFSSLNVGETLPLPFVFALNGNCGDIIPLTLNVTGDNAIPLNQTIPIRLGARSLTLSADFDSSPTALPANWASTTAGSGLGWIIDDLTSDSAPHSVFAANRPSVGESILTTPIIAPLAGAVLSFRHFYNTEQDFDGGVLEISIAGGIWQDITIVAPFTQGGYVGTLSLGANPLSGRNSWNGNSGGFITSEVTLPPITSTESFQLRWRIGYDSSVAATGWNIDTVTIGITDCDTSGPLLTLTSSDLLTSEFHSADTADLTGTAPLRAAIDTPFTLLYTGTASSTLDLIGLPKLVLPAGQDGFTASLQARADDLAEGTETLTVSAPNSNSLSFSLADSPYQAWLASNLAGNALQDIDDDPDGDGISNLMEYLNATNPLIANTPAPLVSRFIDNSVRLTIPSPVPADLSIIPESSSNFAQWLPEFINVSGGEAILAPPSSPYFMRLRYELLSTDSGN